MTDPGLFALSLAALLAIPGPTNALLLMGGVQSGPLRSLPLLAATVGAYILAVGTLVAAGEAMAGEARWASIALRLGLSVYLAMAAVRTWRFAAHEHTPMAAVVGARQVFFVTLLNPKSVVVAFAIAPAFNAFENLPLHAAIFVALVAAVSAGWIAAGSLAGALPGSAGKPLLLRASAVTLAAFAIAIATSAVRAAIG